LSVKGQIKVIWKIENGKKKADAYQEFGFVSYTIPRHLLWVGRRGMDYEKKLYNPNNLKKNRTKIITAFEWMDQEESYSESLNKVV
jgi:hypothetical protein